MNDSPGGRYWGGEATAKTFSHPVNLEWLRPHLPLDAWVLDYGCGYGRVLDLLHRVGYRNLVGVDASAGMIDRARTLYPHLDLQQIDPPHVPYADGHFDAVLLFAVLTCIPGDADQQALLRELYRVVRPGGLLYVSDYPLQTDARNLARYARFAEQCGSYGVFEVSAGVAVRHHRREWIDGLLAAWERIAVANIQVVTMNGNPADGFQWLGRKPAH
jgi:SAM-dependent methyltransferase